MRQATSNAGELFLVNDHAPVSWEEQANRALAEADEHWAGTTLVDWHAAAGSRDGLTYDGIHLTAAGAVLYARLISRAVRANAARREPNPRARHGG